LTPAAVSIFLNNLKAANPKEDGVIFFRYLDHCCRTLNQRD
jgi:hypothetical protein